MQRDPYLDQLDDLEADIARRTSSPDFPQDMILSAIRAILKIREERRAYLLAEALPEIITNARTIVRI